MNKKIAIGLSAAAMLFASTGMARADLITNGGFETPAASSGSYAQFFNGSSMGGWTVTGNDVLLINSSYSEDSLVFNALSGSQSLDISGAGNTGHNGINQDIATVTGQSYTLTFYVGNATTDGSFASYYALASTIGLSIDGATEQLFTNSTVSLNGINWEAFTVTFTAASNLTNIAFFNETTGDNEAGLDGISLNAVPEPETLALFGIGGLLAFGAMRGRKAKKKKV